MTLLDTIEIDIGEDHNNITVYVEVFDNSLSRKWLASLNQLISGNYHLEKNYCWFGFPDSARDGRYLLKQINDSISAINGVGFCSSFGSSFVRLLFVRSIACCFPSHR